MSTFVLLLMTTSVPSFDPVPVADSAPSYGESGWSGRSSGGRRGFFGRIRGFFTRRTRESNSPNPAGAKQATGGMTPTPVPAPATGEVLPTPISPARISPAPFAPYPGIAAPQRMPVGTPLPQVLTPSPF